MNTNIYAFDKTTKVPGDLKGVFLFFSKAENLQRITPPWLQFKILSPLPITIEQDTLIDYQIRLYGFPIRWRTKITSWEPPHRFVDTQIKGPYTLWIHEHRFEQTDGHVTIYDHIDYKIPGGIVSPILNKFFVKADIEKIFNHRQNVIQQIFS
jgi:ligand-binding SRPBCC domain-containing protein